MTDERKDMTDLRVDEPSEHLLELEVVVEEGLETFFEVGTALREIRNDLLYKERGYGTFDAYIRKEWYPRISASRALQLIDAARTQEHLQGLHTNVESLPLTEGAMRPLADQMPLDSDYERVMGRPSGPRPETTVVVDRTFDLIAKDPRVTEKTPPTDAVVKEHLKTAMLELRPETTERGNEPGKVRDPYVEPGHLYQVGPHRVLCGDASDPDVVRRALGDLVPNLLLTDPPYGVDYEGKTEEALTIQDDGADTDIAAQAFRALEGILPPGTSYYVCAPAGDAEYAMRDAVKLLGPLRQSLVWYKDVFVLGRQDYQWKHELLMYGWVEGAAHSWYGGRDKTTVWEIDRPKASREHPTMKPLALMAEPIINSTREGDVVLDVFAGSGSTVVAAAQLGRIGVAIEIDPGFAQGTLERLENEVHEQAVLIED